MLLRIKRYGEVDRDKFEKTALKITGTSFYILVVGLIATAVYNIITNHKPQTTFWGIVVALVSIAPMSLLIYYKKKIGAALNSEALIAEANCTKTCLYLSVILFLASAGYQITRIGGIDSWGALLIAYFSYKEGKESFEKAESDKYCRCEK